MARYKKNEFSQNLLISISLQEQIMPGSLEDAIQTIVDERMDMSLFDFCLYASCPSDRHWQENDGQENLDFHPEQS